MLFENDCGDLVDQDWVGTEGIVDLGREAARGANVAEDTGRNIPAARPGAAGCQRRFTLGDLPEATIVLKSPEGIFRVVRLPRGTELPQELGEPRMNLVVWGQALIAALERREGHQKQQRLVGSPLSALFPHGNRPKALQQMRL
jgi:hypothetical protein